MPPPSLAPRHTAASVALDTPADCPNTCPGIPGETLRLLAEGDCLRWDAPSSERLIKEGLREAIGALRRSGRKALLAGVLPYPGGRMEAAALLFEAYKESRSPLTSPHPFRLTKGFAPDTSRETYLAGVRRILQYLRAGDAYQVNLAQRFTACYEGNPLALYEHLRAKHLPPHAAWMDLGDTQVLSFSPESFLSVRDRRVVTSPIKGTRRRGDTPTSDRAIRDALQAAEKDRAENLMIVDLMRNDLGQVCDPGSIRVPSLFRTESYSNVHHLVSTVEGRLSLGHDIPDLLATCFPGGSITGAPKRRAMEIIAELEPHPREIYCGSVFWMTADGRFASNIAIRTLLARGGHLHCWAGAGIVADSDPESEHQECLDKIETFMRDAEYLFLNKRSQTL